MNNIGDINFVELDIKKLYKNAVDKLQKELGETLYEGDERLIFFQNMFNIQVAQAASVNDAARQNLLRYARGEKLDAIGVDFYFTERLQAEKATCECKVTLSMTFEIDTVIPKGTRITTYEGDIYFESESDIIIKAGQTEGTGRFVAQREGSKYSGLIEGTINRMVDVIPYVISIENLTRTVGGADIESDESYRERCRLSRNIATTGPEDSYRFFAMSVNAAVKDAKPIMSSPGVVRIILLLEDAAEASEKIINDVKNACSAKDRRPLTDKVEVVSAETIPYNINLTYYFDSNHSTEEAKYRKAIEGENNDYRTGAIRDYIKWQQNTLGLSISPDELRYKIQDSSTYTTMDGKKHTAVRRIEITEPSFVDIDPEKIGRVGTINVVYGGLE